MLLLISIYYSITIFNIIFWHLILSYDYKIFLNINLKMSYNKLFDILYKFYIKIFSHVKNARFSVSRALSSQSHFWNKLAPQQDTTLRSWVGTPNRPFSQPQARFLNWLWPPPLRSHLLRHRTSFIVCFQQYLRLWSSLGLLPAYAIPVPLDLGLA